MRLLPETSIPTTHILKKTLDGAHILEKEELFPQEVVNAPDLVLGTILGGSYINKRGVLVF